MTTVTSDRIAKLAPLVAQALGAVQAWATPNAFRLFQDAASAALAQDGGDPTAAAILSHALHSYCSGPGGLAARLTADGDCAPLIRGGMLKIDADLADWWALHWPDTAVKVRLSAAKKVGDYLAGTIDAQEVVRKWSDGGRPRLVSLARRLWLQKVALDWESARRAVALPKPLLESLSILLAPRPRQLEFTVDGGNLEVVRRGGRHKVAEHDATPELQDCLGQLLARGGHGPTRLGEPDALRLLVFLQALVNIQRALGISNHREIHIERPAPERLARMAGLSVDGRKHVLAYLEEMHQWRWQIPGYRKVAGLATWRQSTGGSLVIELTRVAAGEAVDELRELGETPPQVLLATVPLPHPFWDVDAVGPRLRRKAAAFVLRVWLELHSRSIEPASTGVVLDKRAPGLAGECGLEPRDARRLIDAWVVRGYLKYCTDSDSWALGEVHGHERAFLVEGARRSAAGRCRQRSARAKRC